MYDASSPILDFYPEDFEEDMNGKKQSWEATVKIPFIDHDRLLKAMACTSRLDQGRGAC
jgi:5'-3' exoribonuclease 1